MDKVIFSHFSSAFHRINTHKHSQEPDVSMSLLSVIFCSKIVLWLYKVSGKIPLIFYQYAVWKFLVIEKLQFLSTFSTNCRYYEFSIMGQRRGQKNTSRLNQPRTAAGNEPAPILQLLLNCPTNRFSNIRQPIPQQEAAQLRVPGIDFDT